MEIRDPIHQFITLSKLEQRVIDTAPVQRLRHIHQLSLTYLVYPGAVHTRFEHALGTMELAGRAFDSALRNSNQDFLGDIGLGDNESRARARTLVRLAGLLHDVGHSPFSHGPEELFPQDADGSKIRHEHLTARLIEDSEITEALRTPVTGVDPSEVAALAVGSEYREISDPLLRLLSDLVTGTLGVDRMDYLLRDTMYTGVGYGQFDLGRIISTLKIIKTTTGEPGWALEAGGSYIAEQMLMARLFMSLQVYFHKTRRVLDWHLQEFLRTILPNGHFPIDISEYLKLTDTEVLSRMRAHASPHATAILKRRHWRCAWEASTKEEAEKFDNASTKIWQAHKNLFIDDEVVAIRKPGDGELWIEESDGNILALADRSDLVSNLTPRRVLRVYAPLEQREQVRNTLQEVLR